MAHHPQLLLAAKTFNSGNFFEAHEHLEEALESVEEDDQVWRLFVALIQISVGYHKLSHHYAGGLTMLQKGLEKLKELPLDCGGVRIDLLLTKIQEDLTIVDGTIPEAPRIRLSRMRSPAPAEREPPACRKT